MTREESASSERDGDLGECPSLEELEAALAGADPPAEVARHLDSCARCQRRAEAVRRDDSFVAELVQLTGSSAARSVSMLTDLPSGYDVLGEIHRGGQGVVYEARRRSTGDVLALKLPLRAEERGDLRFQREIRLVTELAHPGIVALADSGTTPEGRPFFAMERVQGLAIDAHADSVRSVVGTEGLVHLFLRVADAVDYAHGQGVIHRDLKPSNVMVDAAGGPRVLDFGLAKTVSVDEASIALTRSGEFLGSLAWTAPEQIQGRARETDARTDVHALGLILYRMLFGRHAYELSGPMENVVRTILRASPTHPARMSRGERELFAVVKKALHKDPVDRYQSVAVLAADCRRALENRPVHARSSAWSTMRRTVRHHPLIAGLATVVTVTGVVLLLHLERRAASLSESLFRSDIDRARLRTRMSEVPAAEDLIWRHAFERGPRTSEGITFAGSAGVISEPIVRWSARELYALHPCRATVQAYRDEHPMVAVAPGDLLLTGTRGCDTVLLWRLPGLERDGTLPVGPGLLRFAAHPQRSILATARLGAGVELWDLASRTAPQTLDADSEPIRGLEFSRDGSVLVAISGTRLRVWDAADFHLRSTVASPSGESYSTGCVAPDGRSLAVQLADKTICVLDPSGRPMTPRVPRRAMSSLTFSLDGRTLYLSQSNVRTMDLRDGLLVDGTMLDSVLGMHSHLAVAPGGRWLATSGGKDHAIRIWDPGSLSSIRELGGHRSQVTAVQAAPDGDLLITADASGCVKTWDLREGVFPSRPGGEAPEHTSTVLSMGASPHDERLATGGGDCALRVWLHGELLSTLELPDVLVQSVAFSPTDPRLLAFAGSDGAVRRLTLGDEAGSEAPVSLLGRHADGANFVAFDPGGGRLASVDNRGDLIVWDLATSSAVVRARSPTEARLSSVVWTPDARWIAAGSRDGGVWWYEVATARSRMTGERHAGHVTCIDAAPRGGLVATGSRDLTVRVWVVDAEESAATLTAHGAEIYAVRFSPDGSELWSADSSGALYVWDVETWSCMAEFHHDGKAIHAMAFLANGATLATGGENQRVLLWDMAPLDRRIGGNAAIQRDRLVSR